MSEIATGPKYTHDCDHCQYCGEYDGKDLWVCVIGPEKGTAILRYGDDGPEYECMGLATLRSISQQIKEQVAVGLSVDSHTERFHRYWVGAFEQAKEMSDE